MLDQPAPEAKAKITKTNGEEERVALHNSKPRMEPGGTRVCYGEGERLQCRTLLHAYLAAVDAYGAGGRAH